MWEGYNVQDSVNTVYQLAYFSCFIDPLYPKIEFKIQVGILLIKLRLQI